ncbi:protein-arginine kinase activator protein [Polycladomyces abyssicola]|jgi:protein arginine kinase activator|uniref:Protein-arginine kinase activator protein n=1 Tax=Polycladomyces abyssicola TaxID=1125966 RepID=A0A8D5ZMF0_9BACL|nr:UvrB/UvrC motif-containing protein [Polycladomyces abyssicola]BCU80356.1 protein-arginine kinase activator protein [Polycladomyces abyssicola]
MLCQECGKRPATLHYTKIVNGEKTEFHLCEVCAQEKGEQIPMMENGFSIHQLLSGLLNFDAPYTEGEQAKQTVQSGALRCPTCGLTYTQFSKIGRLGCSDCYQAFGERLIPLFRRVHGSTNHRGKVPERTGGRLKIRREIEQLKEQLKQCVAREAFEEAARLRDRIRALQRKLEG